MSNRLSSETSPYLLQHAENPVNWYPWNTEAFDAARNQDKPVLVSIGYSTCHWCHVMAHESFEDGEIAEILNTHFISVKVDKEERPDIDSLYMSVCQAFTGSGGWPLSVFMTADQKPFFAGTYFPKTARYGTVGFKELLLAVADQWTHDRSSLLHSAEKVVNLLQCRSSEASDVDSAMTDRALELYEKSYDETFGGFGNAPKFPAPHNLMFLLQQHEKEHRDALLRMAEKTLFQMYRGGLFDHIGYGFCRYSTDRYFLVPHFEKMLYDNALLILAYAKAFEVTEKPFYRTVAEKTAGYLLNEMQAEGGGFFSAQDADSDGEEGRYYVFTRKEIRNLLGETDGSGFCDCFDISVRGNFDGKNIPNLLHSRESPDRFDRFLPELRRYRKQRGSLSTDDKILTAWNSLAIAALCSLYRISRDAKYLTAAENTLRFLQHSLMEDDTLYVGFRNGKRSGKGFLDDYASYIWALLSLYNVTLDQTLLETAERMTHKTVKAFFDDRNGGFYLSGTENETLVVRSKESYDGAVPSSNSLMTYHLVRLSYLIPDYREKDTLEKQLRFMTGEAKHYPAGYSMFLIALSDYTDPPAAFTVVGDIGEIPDLPFSIPSSALVRVLKHPTAEYPMKNGQLTIYPCESRSCRPPLTKQEFLAQFCQKDRFGKNGTPDRM